MATKYSQIVRFAGKPQDPKLWQGGSVFLLLCIFVLGLILTYLLASTVQHIAIGWIVTIIISFFSAFAVYLYLFFISQKRADEVNNELPNALSSIAGSLRAGMTPFYAVKAASIGEFGLLGEEFKRATNRAIGVKPFTHYLLDIPNRVNSSQLNRSLRLFVSSLRSGGHVTELLDELAEDMTQRFALKNELLTYMKTNVMFIMFIIIIGTPLLLSISLYFLDTVTEIQQSNAGALSDDNFSLGLGGEIAITSAFLLNVSYVMIFLTGILACFFLGGVMDGDIKKGLRYAPYLILGPYILFFIARFLMTSLLGG